MLGASNLANARTAGRDRAVESSTPPCVALLRTHRDRPRLFFFRWVGPDGWPTAAHITRRNRGAGLAAVDSLVIAFAVTR